MNNRNLSQIRKDYLGDEVGALPKKEGLLRVCLVYASSYGVAMTSLGYQAIYTELSSRPDTLCERAFYDKELGFRTLESGKSLRDFDLIAASISFELDYLNLARMLKSEGIPLRREERSSFDPLICIGGSAISMNPEPMFDFVDFFIIGPGRKTIHQAADALVRAKETGQPLISALEELQDLQGFYIPALHKDRTAPVRVGDFTEWAETQILTPRAAFASTHLLEVSRGCPRRCRFCWASFGNPFQNQPFEQLTNSISRMAGKYRDGLDSGQGPLRQIGLVGSAVFDYPWLGDLANFLYEEKIPFTVSSLRADKLSDALLRALAFRGWRSLTFAPEVATERMGKVVRKWIPPEVLVETIDHCMDYGIRNFKLYFLFGLPGEEDSDVEAIADLLKSLRASLMRKGNGKKLGRLTASCNPFIPKPFTPFDKEQMAPMEVLKQRLKILKKADVGPDRIKLIHESLRSSLVQDVLSRGDRETGELIEEVAFSPSSVVKKVEAWIKRNDFHRKVSSSQPPWWIVSEAAEVPADPYRIPNAALQIA